MASREEQVPMRTFPRPGRVPAYGLVDALVGILILVLVAACVAASFSTFSRLAARQSQAVDTILSAADADARSGWY